MFNKARLKLTGWYLIIIMFISMLFSVVIYKTFSDELDRIERMEVFRLQRSGQILDFPIDPSDIKFQPIEDARFRLGVTIVVINIAILAVSGGLSYFLAGRTLAPIKKMLDEQHRFITDASHELRTPLTTLKTEIEVNLRDKGFKLSDAKKLLQSNLEEVNNLQSLSDHLLELAQYEKGNSTYAMHNLSIKNIIEASLKRVKSLAEAKEIKIVNKVTDEKIKGIEKSLVELFVILLDNAIKYSEPHTEVAISSKKTDHTLSIAIADEGMGIDEKDLPFIFDRFYRSDKSRTKATVSGYGLGLSIAKKIVQMHNGEIKVESRVNNGSVFTVLLPTASV